MFLRGLGNIVHSEVSVEIGHISISLKRNCHGACLMAERLKLCMLYFCGAGSVSDRSLTTVQEALSDPESIPSILTVFCLSNSILLLTAFLNLHSIFQGGPFAPNPSPVFSPCPVSTQRWKYKAHSPLWALRHGIQEHALIRKIS